MSFSTSLSEALTIVLISCAYRPNKTVILPIGTANYHYKIRPISVLMIHRANKHFKNFYIAYWY